MGWFSGLVGGGIGAIIAGPFGAIIGVAIGSSIGNAGQGGLAAGRGRMFEAQQRQALFFTAAYSIACRWGSTHRLNLFKTLDAMRLKYETSM